MTSNVEILIRGRDQASPAIRGVGDALQGLHDTAKSSGGGIVGSLQRIGETAAGFLIGQAVPALFGMGQAAITAGADYGAVMNRIQAVSGATTQELAAMNAKALELGAALPISAKDAADAMYALVTAGYSASDAIAASTGVAQLASSQMMGVGQASEIVASALRGFGMEAGQASHVVDLLSQTASISAVEVTDIGETIKYVGAVAGAAHQPMEDISAAIALMGNNGIKASMAGTALRSMITNLQAPTESAAAALANMGIQTSDAGGHMLPLMDIMSQFRDKMSGMSDAQQAQIAKAIAGKEAMAGFLSIVNAAPGDFDRITAAMQNAEGATDKFATAMNKGLKFEWGQLQGSIETVLIQGFQAAEPILVALASAATGFVNSLGAGLQAAGPAIQQVASQITGIVQTFQSQGAVAGGGAILQALGLTPDMAGQAGALMGQLQTAVQTGTAQITAAWATNGPQITAFVMQIVASLSELAGWLAGQLPPAITIVTGAIVGLASVLSFLIANWQGVATVVGLVAGAIVGSQIAALIGGLVAAFTAVGTAAAAAGGILPLVGIVIAALGGPITIVIALVGALAAAWATNFLGIRDITANAWVGIQAAFAAGQAAVQSALAWLAAAWAQIASATAAAWAAITSSLTAAWTGITTAVMTGLTAIQAAWTAGWAAVQAATSTAWSVITAVFNAGWSVVQGVTSVAWAVLSTLFNIGMAVLQAVTSTAWGAISALWTSAWAQIQAVTAPAWAAIQSLWNSGTSAIQAATATAWGNITTAWNTAWLIIQTVTAVAWAAIATQFGTAWGQLTSATATAWSAMTAVWNTAWSALQAVTGAAWGAISAAWGAGWGHLQAITAPAWNALQGMWNSAWGALQGLTNSAWNAVQAQWNNAWGNVRSTSASAWSQTQSDWSSRWSGLQSLTASAWNTVQSQWNTAWNAVKATNPQAWGEVETAWVQGWTSVQTTTATAWANIVTAWTQAWGVVTGLTSEAWGVINGIWNDAVAFVQGLMDKLGAAFEGVSAAIRGTIAALKRLADTARDLAGAIPDWMRPGSPMPLGIAFEHLASTLPTASAAMAQFGQTAQNAGAAPTVDIQVLVNGQSAGNVGAFAQNLVNVVRALIPPLASLGTTVTEEVKTSLGRVNEGLKSIQSILETTFRLVALTLNPPSLPSVAPNSPVLVFFGNVTTWARTVVTAAAGVANGFEEVKSAGLTALNTVAGQVKSLIEATFALIAVTVNPPALPDVMTAGNPTITWFRNVTEWAKRVTTAAAGVANGFEQIQVGGLQALNNAAGPLKALLDTTFGLVAQAANPPSLPDVTVGSPTLTWFINATEWTKRVASAVAGVANGFESVLTAGLTALNTAAGATLGLIKAAIDTIAAVADPPSIPVVTAGSTLYVFLVSLVGFARRVTEIALTAAAGFTAAAGDGLAALNTATGQALGVLKNTLDLLIAANTEYVIPDNFVDTIKELVRVGMDMAAAFLEIANTFTGIVTPAATQAARAMDMASKFIKDVYDLGKQMVKEPPTFPTNFRALIQQLVQMGKDIAVAFIEEADRFATNVGPGAVALLDVYGKMDDFFKGFNKAVLAVQAIESVPTDAPAKVTSIMAIATQMAQNYITAANSFEGVKGEGATNLENILGKFAALTKNVKDILKTLEDWGTAGITSDSIAPALALFASVLNTFATQSEGAGTTAGGGFMTAFAQAIRDNASQVYDALREVLAGANALLPGGSGGGGGGGGGQGAGATLAGANTGTPAGNSDSAGVEAAVASGVERGMKAAQQASAGNGPANAPVEVNVTVNLSTALGLDSSLTMLTNMARG